MSQEDIPSLFDLVRMWVNENYGAEQLRVWKWPVGCVDCYYCGKELVKVWDTEVDLTMPLTDKACGGPHSYEVFTVAAANPRFFENIKQALDHHIEDMKMRRNEDHARRRATA